MDQRLRFTLARLTSKQPLQSNQACPMTYSYKKVVKQKRRTSNILNRDNWAIFLFLNSTWPQILNYAKSR